MPVAGRHGDIHLALSTGLAVVLLAAFGCGDGNDAGPVTAAATESTTETSAGGARKLIGTVGSVDDPDAHEIHLKTEVGAEVTTILPPGEYVLEINDLSTIHNFHLGGPRAGVDVATDVAGTGETTAFVTLHEGESYVYVCDAHPATMTVTFSIHGRIRTQN